MNEAQTKLTIQKFPTLFSFINSYEGEDPQNILYQLKNTPFLLWSEVYWKKVEKAFNGLLPSDGDYIQKKLLSVSNSWSQFEDIINEVLTYDEYKVDGNQPKFIQSKSSPDIEASDDSGRSIVIEVKTIHRSIKEQEQEKKDLGKVGGRFLELNIHPTLFKKIREQIGKAMQQVWSYRSTEKISRKVYLWLSLDTGPNIDTIFVKDSEVNKYISLLKKELKDGNFPLFEGKGTDLIVYHVNLPNWVEIK